KNMTSLFYLDLSDNNIYDISPLLDKEIVGGLILMPNPILQSCNLLGHIADHEGNKIPVYEEHEGNKIPVNEKQEPTLAEQEEDKETSRLLSIEALLLITIFLMLIIIVLLIVFRRKKQESKEAYIHRS
ncbi:MAG: hypothetical protein GX461_06695, partial [Clostridiales bacterium]|nr:hypothetical protein [Clostridiales bacterium]